MEMKQCTNGHFYDAEKNASCPYCNGGNEIGVTRPLNGGATMGETMPVYVTAPAFPKTVPVGNVTSPAYPGGGMVPPTAPVIGGESGKTVALHINEANIDPVRGWLVCVEGNKKGKDFKIQSERNFIGRSKSNTICLEFDPTISKERHAVLTYDLRANKFWIQIGDGVSSIYLNDEIVLVPMELKPYDIITIGESKLSFVPFCTDAFKW